MSRVFLKLQEREIGALFFYSIDDLINDGILLLKTLLFITSDTQLNTISLNVPNQVGQEDFVLVPVQTFRKWQEEGQALRQTLKQQQELVEVLEITREGEEEYRRGLTTTEPLASLVK